MHLLYFHQNFSSTLFNATKGFRAFLDIIESFERSGFCDLTKSSLCQKHWDGGIPSISQRRQGAKDPVELIAMLCFYYFTCRPHKLGHLFSTRFAEILNRGPGRCKGIALRYSPRWTKKSCRSNRFNNIKKRSKNSFYEMVQEMLRQWHKATIVCGRYAREASGVKGPFIRDRKRGNVKRIEAFAMFEPGSIGFTMRQILLGKHCSVKIEMQIFSRNSNFPELNFPANGLTG